MELQDVNSPSPVYKAMYHKYFYSYNNSNEDDIYRASLDFPKLKADGYNFHSLDFAIDVGFFWSGIWRHHYYKPQVVYRNHERGWLNQIL